MAPAAAGGPALGALSTPSGAELQGTGLGSRAAGSCKVGWKKPGVRLPGSSINRVRGKAAAGLPWLLSVRMVWIGVLEIVPLGCFRLFHFCIQRCFRCI